MYYYYLLECLSCETITQVITEAQTGEDEPCYCPMCSVDINAQIIDSLRDEYEEEDEE